MSRIFIIIDGDVSDCLSYISQCFPRLKINSFYRQNPDVDLSDTYWVFGQGNNAFGQPVAKKRGKFRVWFRFKDLKGLENEQEFIKFLRDKQIPYSLEF
ncbi:hypothetical protein BegalDRAFT_1477 [Beggiatoa alba B18LD]|uniref:Uncharacterized protein n=1 Tax=Beggiatoa alba B18LD TaxID=395493 RepID=I3CFH2_9GAMM|nr:hypothetical protein [Beggiatoa alba]EIJ42365.1 hypothetical protein BegalDRAFT_1477 [Beggiatoa alba B18LD]